VPEASHELWDLEQKLEQVEEELRSTGAMTRAHSFYILQTLRKLPPGTLKREGTKVSFTPAPPKVEEMTTAQRQRNFRRRARVMLALAGD
jgi:hypothetical protein